MCAVTARLYVLVTLLAACGDPAAHVHLVPIELPTMCGKPPRGRVTTMTITAYATTAEHAEVVSPAATGELQLSDLPGDTEQIGVELSDDSGVIAAGKTAPLAFDSLRDGASIPIAVLPIENFCTTGAPHEARAQPLVARAGDGVLIVGGYDASGNPLATAEYYDRASATFTEIAVPVQLDATGFSGAALAELSDGTVLVTAPQHVGLVFDATKLAFTADTFYEDRAAHAMIEVEPGSVLVAGGCLSVTGGVCMSPVHGSYRIPVAMLGDAAARIDAATIGTTQDRARLFDLGMQLDGHRRVVLASSQSTPSTAEGFDPYSAQLADPIAGFHAQVAPLASGALLTAFEPDAITPTGAAAMLAPDATASAPTANAPLLAGARLATLEDGSVLALGGGTTGAFWRYLPTTDSWQPIVPRSGADPVQNPAGAEPPGAIAGPALARLADGSLLVVGATAGGVPMPTAWLYRPSLVGPASGSVLATHDATSGILVPSDPAHVTRGPGATLVLDSPGDAPTSRVLVGGPLTTTGSVGARVVVHAGGVALVAQQIGPGRALVAELVPGAPATIGRRDAGATTPLRCTGQQMVPPFDASATAVVGLAVAGTTATVTLEGVPLATCDLSRDPDSSDRGAWGIAAAGAGAIVEVVTVTVSRSPTGA
jgi:hypothetical protein